MPPRHPQEHISRGKNSTTTTYQVHAATRDGTREKLNQLGLNHAAEALAEELAETVKHNRPAHVLLDRLLSHPYR